MTFTQIIKALLPKSLKSSLKLSMGFKTMVRIGPIPTLFEVMQYMDGKGHRLYDFLPMYYSPLDNALWQGDAFFVRNDSKLVASLIWNN